MSVFPQTFLLPVGDDRRVSRLLQLVRESSVLCLHVINPGWDDARGYLFDPASNVLYFPVSKKYLDGRSFDRYEVLIWSQPRVLVVGHLSPASSDEDAAVQLKLASARGAEPAKIDYMLFDQRNHKHRKNRHKLSIDSMCAAAT
jgi:hypothetical protein